MKESRENIRRRNARKVNISLMQIFCLQIIIKIVSCTKFENEKNIKGKTKKIFRDAR